MWRIELNKLLFLAIGAVPGALLRWQIQNDLIVNLLGTFFLGFIVGLRVNSRNYLLFGVGFCGALTTFSSWMVESTQLILKGFGLKVLLTLFFTLVFGFLAAAIGFFIGRKIIALKHY